MNQLEYVDSMLHSNPKLLVASVSKLHVLRPQASNIYLNLI